MHIYEDTFIGLTKKKDTIFQQLGSMILAKEEKNDFKIKAYLETIAIYFKELKIYQSKKTAEALTIYDIKILKDIITHFEFYVHKLEKMKLDDSDYKMKILTDETPVKSTTLELQTWMTQKFEQLGFICISKLKNETVIVTEYFNSIKLLIASIEKKISEVKEKDTKDDLKIILEKSIFLYIYAYNLLMVGNVKNSLSKKTKKKGWFF